MPLAPGGVRGCGRRCLGVARRGHSPARDASECKSRFGGVDALMVSAIVSIRLFDVRCRLGLRMPSGKLVGSMLLFLARVHLVSRGHLGKSAVGTVDGRSGFRRQSEPGSNRPGVRRSCGVPPRRPGVRHERQQLITRQETSPPPSHTSSTTVMSTTPSCWPGY